MIVFEEPTESGSVSDIMRWYTKDSDGVWNYVAYFPDDGRPEEGALWFDDRNGMELQNNLVSENEGGQLKYHTVLAIYDRADKTKYALLSIELFVDNNGEISFENKWARLSPSTNTRNHASIAASASLMV